jgi:hypothetical protein
MNCQCGGTTRVLDTRLAPAEIVRRRECVICRQRIQTVEVLRAVLEQREFEPPVRKKPRPKRPAKPKAGMADRAGMQARAAARRRLEERRDSLNEISDEPQVLDDWALRRELGW